MRSGKQRSESFLTHLQPLEPALERFCRRALHDPNSLADVLQSAVANAFRDFHLYAEGSNFRAWIFRFVHYEVLNANRKYARTRHVELPEEIAIESHWEFSLNEPLFQALLNDPDEVLEQCDDCLAQAVRELAENERAVLLLHAVGEFKYREIAEIVRIPIGTVMSALARARLKLRERLVDFGQLHGLLKPGTVDGGKS